MLEMIKHNANIKVLELCKKANINSAKHIVITIYPIIELYIGFKNSFAVKLKKAYIRIGINSIIIISYFFSWYIFSISFWVCISTFLSSLSCFEISLHAQVGTAVGSAKDACIANSKNMPKIIIFEFFGS